MTPDRAMTGKSWMDIFHRPPDGVMVFDQYAGTVNGMIMYPNKEIVMFCALGDFAFITADDENDPPERFFIYQGDSFVVRPGTWIGSKAIGSAKGILVCGSFNVVGKDSEVHVVLPYDHFGKDVWEVVSA